ncbi:hypothetical protein [Nocardioides sp. 616]|uniref:hypothetical protein n=1 Tax=Nocardioides sp. 616 TaxID=2268090 RepID=UPI0013B3759B|nr:hypothetical protein [Nocardioides sp. 616]
MPTAPSSTEVSTRARLAELCWAPVVDTAHLLRFRSASVRRPLARRVGWSVLLVITLGAATLPALAPSAGGEGRAFDTLLLLPSLMAGFGMLAIVSAVASGGGRELLAHEHAVAFPVSPTTDHLGALLMAPLNIAWLLQAWFLLGAAAFGQGLSGLPGVQVVMVLWLLVATTAAQAVAWTMEAIRRSRHGVAAFRTISGGVGAGAVWLQLSGNLGSFLDVVPTLHLLVAARSGLGVDWAGAVAVELLLTLGAVVLGAWPAHLAARRLARDELKAESNVHPARALPRSAFAMLVRIDRASVWRAVPMRRGLAVLALGPGLVAVAGAMTWDTVTILPGLVVSGGVLLFGVNAWSLDGRGGLWRESLPVDPALVFRARSAVMTEWLLAAAMITVVLASLRAGTPTTSELTALACTVLVVTVQVVAVAMTWSARRPFAVNLRSARATPAPPIVMVGYSARLATSTTLTAMVFSTLSQAAPWWVVAAVAVPFLSWSTVRWCRASRVWQDPAARAVVVTTVAA